MKKLKYNFTDGTFAIELDDDNTMKVLKRLEKEHPDLQTELGFSATKTRYGSKYIYCGNDGFLWSCGKTYCLAKKLKTITAEEYLSQFEEEPTYEKLLKCDGKMCVFKYGNEKQINEGVIKKLGDSFIYIETKDNLIRLYNKEDYKVNIKNLKLIEEKEKPMKNESIIENQSKIIQKLNKENIMLVKKGAELEKKYKDFLDVLSNYCDSVLQYAEKQVESVYEKIHNFQNPSPKINSETITVEKKVYDIMQKNSLDKIETQHENKMLKQKIAGMIKPKINPKTGQYLEMPENGTDCWFIDFEMRPEAITIETMYDTESFNANNLFHTKEACEIFAKKIRELLKGGV